MLARKTAEVGGFYATEWENAAAGSAGTAIGGHNLGEHAGGEQEHHGHYSSQPAHCPAFLDFGGGAWIGIPAEIEAD